MSNRIPYNQADSNTAKMLAQAVSKVNEAVNALNRVGVVLDSAIFGAPADDMGVAIEVGCSTANAHDLWTLVSTAREKLNDPAVKTMISRLDQG